MPCYRKWIDCLPEDYHTIGDVESFKEFFSRALLFFLRLFFSNYAITNNNLSQWTTTASFFNHGSLS